MADIPMVVLDTTDDCSDDYYDLIMRKNLENRVLVLNCGVDSSLLEDVLLFIMYWNKEDKYLPVDERVPIKLYINSEGGDAYSAYMLIDAIRNSKTPVYGVGFGLVASAAYYVYIACHRRYSFENTTFLQHDGYIEVNNSAGKTKDVFEFNKKLEDRFKKLVIERTNIDSEFYDKKYASEMYMFADEAKENGVVDEIIGIDCDINKVL